MPGTLAIVAYRSVVGGAAQSSLDVQVRWFDDEDADRVQAKLRAEPAHTYRNPTGEEVIWELAEILAVEPFDPSTPADSGEEIAGFIASVDEISELARGPRDVT
jgi:hypothetical protein